MLVLVMIAWVMVGLCVAMALGHWFRDLRDRG